AEYGATMGFFPVDSETVRYLERTGRDPKIVARAESYCTDQQLFRTDDTPDPRFTDTPTTALPTIAPALAGPRRPQDLVPLTSLKRNCQVSLPELLPPAAPAARHEL